MEEKNLVVCDKDSRYANGLAENISERKELALHVYVCTGMSRAGKFMEERPPDIFIVDESFSQKERQAMQASQVFVLTKDGCKDLAENEKEIFKFQSADKILGDVFETYYNRTNSSILKTIKKPKQRLIAVYSPIHRIGKTTFALSLGEELAKSEKVLYLNLEAFPDVNNRLPKVEGKNLGDLLYYMRQDVQDVAMRLISMIEKRGELDVLPPILNHSDLRGVTSEDWKALIEQVLNDTAYETVILDLSDGIQGFFQLLDGCDQIYMPILEDEISRAKVKQFEYNLRLHQLMDMKDKIRAFLAAEDMKACAVQWIKEEK